MAKTFYAMGVDAHVGFVTAILLWYNVDILTKDVVRPSFFLSGKEELAFE